MKTNGERSPEEIQADVERTRYNLDHTLSAIEQRLNPSQLFDQGVDYLRHSGAREYMTNLGASAKQEPLPLALVGIGLAWLMLSNRNGHTSASRLTDDDLAASDRGPAHAIADGIRGTVSSVRDGAARTSHRISEATHRVGQTAHAARERAGQMSAAARERAEQLRHGYDRVVNEHPLALGAVGLAIGAVLAATAPRSRQEDRLMGNASHRVKDSLNEAGQEQLDRAAAAAHAARVEASAGPGMDTADLDCSDRVPPRTSPATAPH